MPEVTAGLPRSAAFAKRSFDILLSAIGLALVWPVIFVAFVVASVDTGANGFFTQTRIGRFGKPFRVVKIRTMRVGSDTGSTVTTASDSRVTAAGRVLRRAKIDELPQLVNILKGDMSFVGPRPPIPEEVEQYERWQRRRLRMKPGLTCLWQAQGRNDIDFDEWMKLDLQYIDTWSLLLDFKICLRTIPIVLLGRGR